MTHTLLSFLTLVALGGTFLPPATCMGFGQPCCCDGPPGAASEAGSVSGDLVSASGCNCRGSEMASCSPDAKPATAPERLTPPAARNAAHVFLAGSALAAPTDMAQAFAPTFSPPLSAPALSFLCCLRI